MTTALALIGAVFGIGLVLVVAGLVPARPSLEAELARLDPYSSSPPAAAGGGPLARLGRPLAGALDNLAGGAHRVERDLAVIGRSRVEHATAVGTAAVVGAAAPAAATALALLVGVRLPLSVPVLGCLVTGIAGAVTPTVSLRRAWLELVALAQAAGMGLESALQAASSVCDDPSFRRIRQAVDVSRGTGVPPWDALTRLGVELAIPDLEELGANLALAGAEGARIRASLTAKSASLRRRELAEAEAEANSTTERLFLPSVVLMLGFTVFVGYPALVTVAHVL
jgi:tight adherence protein C